MTRRLFVAALLSAVLPRPVAGQPRYVDGVFVHTGNEPIELLAFADRVSTGQLRLSDSFEDVPIVERVNRVLCSLPNWKPVLVWASTKDIFRNEYAERRQLPFAVRQINIYALELRIAEVETPERAARVARDVGGTEDKPAFVFVTMQTGGGVTRDYMIQLAPPR
jgi:hypothetical protein